MNPVNKYSLKDLCSKSPENLSAILLGIHSPDIHQLKNKNSMDFQSSVKFEMFSWLKTELYNLWTWCTSSCPVFLYFSSSFAYFKNHNCVNLNLYQKVFRGRKIHIKINFSFLNLTLSYENNISTFLFYLLDKKNLFHSFSFTELPYVLMRPHKMFDLNILGGM